MKNNLISTVVASAIVGVILTLGLIAIFAIKFKDTPTDVRADIVPLRNEVVELKAENTALRKLIEVIKEEHNIYVNEYQQVEQTLESIKDIERKVDILITRTGEPNVGISSKYNQLPALPASYYTKKAEELLDARRHGETD